MPRSFPLTADSTCGTDDFLAAFGDERYWRARLSAMDNGELRSLDVDDAGGIRVRTGFRLLRSELPAIVTKLTRGDWELVHHETWRPAADGQVRGEIGVDLVGAPLSGTGAGRLLPVDGGSRLDYTATVAVRVPLIGGPIEVLIGSQLTKWIAEIQRFTSEWIVTRA